MIIAVDAMGGDNAPGEIVRGCVQALNEDDGFDILLLGDEAQIKEVLASEKYDESRIKIRHTTEVITNDDMPTKAIKQKKDSSLVVGFNMIKQREADVLISAGSSGALLTGSVLILKRIPGIDRPAVASVLPTKKGRVLLLDSGFNTMCRPNNYVQFGFLGAAYLKAAFGDENPRVGLVNIGVEEEKGSDVVKEAHKLLKTSGLNYVGNIESREFFNDAADVLVTDGFTGNVMLKLIEGASDFFFGEIKSLFKKNFISKLSYLMIKGGVGEFKKKVDPDVLGGAPVLGVDGLVVKSHGSSKARTIKYVILRAKALAKSNIIQALTDNFADVSARTEEPERE
ncbi:MAG: phosphate acyltransferase PlsX [Clostridia bacterium]|nr:phosphate acyltransferase PlsX [Clostridia bacterium]